jgi:hypothetical protein
LREIIRRRPHSGAEHRCAYHATATPLAADARAAETVVDATVLAAERAILGG